MICSSVVIEKEIVDKVGRFDIRGTGDEDYDYWLRSLKYTDSVYLDNVCFYYNSGHGNGKNWG